MIGGRSSGKMLAQRLAIRQQVLLGGHMHVAAPDGLWCITADPRQMLSIGPLWEKIRQTCPDAGPKKGGHRERREP